jgi:transcriptional regulator with XRE-family HTH domain
MSEQPITADGLPKWDLSDKLAKSLRHAGLGVADMADYLDVSTRTISNWLSGRIEPNDRTMRLWALRTGIPYTWYCHGDLRPCDYGPSDATSPQAGAKVYKMQRKPPGNGPVNQAG